MGYEGTWGAWKDVEECGGTRRVIEDDRIWGRCGEAPHEPAAGGAWSRTWLIWEEGGCLRLISCSAWWAQSREKAAGAVLAMCLACLYLARRQEETCLVSIVPG